MMLAPGLGQGISLTALTALLLLFSPVLMEVGLGQSQPTPGWYTNSGRALIYEDSKLKIEWQSSYIYQHPGTDNLYWYAQVIYTNKDNKILKVDCTAPNEFPPAREHITRGGTYLGFVDASETFCSRSPAKTVYLEPGQTLNDWAIFHNVPWIGDQVRLQWDPYPFSPWINPWPPPPFAGPPPAECPPELVNLGTCKQAEIPSKQLTPEELQMIEDVPLCAGDVLEVIPGIGQVTTLKHVIDGVKIGTTAIAIWQDPKNPDHTYELILELAALPIPLGSCIHLVGAIFLGQFVGPIHPVIIPPGIAQPKPVPTPPPPAGFDTDTISDTYVGR
jgi:hypothetical protein